MSAQDSAQCRGLSGDWDSPSSCPHGVPDLVGKTDSKQSISLFPLLTSLHVPCLLSPPLSLLLSFVCSFIQQMLSVGSTSRLPRARDLEAGSSSHFWPLAFTQLMPGRWTVRLHLWLSQVWGSHLSTPCWLWVSFLSFNSKSLKARKKKLNVMCSFNDRMKLLVKKTYPTLNLPFEKCLSTWHIN